MEESRPVITYFSVRLKMKTLNCIHLKRISKHLGEDTEVGTHELCSIDNVLLRNHHSRFLKGCCKKILGVFGNVLRNTM